VRALITLVRDLSLARSLLFSPLSQEALRDRGRRYRQAAAAAEVV
jgi:hypothetical protein